MHNRYQQQRFALVLKAYRVNQIALPVPQTPSCLAAFVVGASSFSAMRMLLEQLGMPYAAARFDAEEITPGMVQVGVGGWATLEPQSRVTLGRLNR